MTQRLNSNLGILDVTSSPLIMPLSLTISEVSLQGTVHISASTDEDGKKTLAAYFAEDPLQSVKVIPPVRYWLA